MGLFKKLICEALLTESSVEIPDIESALADHKVIQINYNSPDTKEVASGERIIYPIAYGISLKGNPVIRAYQPQGDTSSKVPSWKLFRLDRIENWEDTDDVFTTRDVPNLRLKHDDGMSIEYKSAFGGEGNQAPEGIDKNQYDSTSVTKKEVEKPETLSQKAEEEPNQNVTIGNEPENIDNATQNTHIPSGINQNVPLAPETKPITANNPVFNNTDTGEEEDTEEQPDLNADSSTPVYGQELDDANTEDNTENDEEENNEDEDEFLEEIRKITSLNERINKVGKRL